MLSILAANCKFVVIAQLRQSHFYNILCSPTLSQQVHDQIRLSFASGQNVGVHKLAHSARQK